MTPDEIERLARMAIVYRQDWVLKSTITQLTNYAHAHPERTYSALAHALLALVLDPDTKTPARLAEAGPWWGSQAPANPKDKPAWYGPTAQFCGYEFADEDTGQPKRCGRVLPAEGECDHGRHARGDRRRQTIAKLRQEIAEAQGSIERTEGAIQSKRDAAQEAAA